MSESKVDTRYQNIVAFDKLMMAFEKEQADRKSAENATHLHQMDEQVNKAIATANQAATVARVAVVKAIKNQMDGKFYDIDV